jgi:hypothetical protein
MQEEGDSRLEKEKHHRNPSQGEEENQKQEERGMEPAMSVAASNNFGAIRIIQSG